jgi:perosamine synthetase
MTPTPRLPVLDWGTLSGPKASATPCLLAHPTVQFTVSGRASILLALEMLQIGPGDKVLLPTYHCPTMVAPVVALGAKAFFYPIRDDGAPDLPWILQHYKAEMRVILVAHFFGLPQPLVDIRNWCDQQGVRLIEDCAHSLFGVSSERTVGCWGDLAIASLTKFLPVPEGGCLVDNLVPAPLPKQHPPSSKNQIKAAFDIIHAGVIYGRLTGLGWIFGSVDRLRGMFNPKSSDCASIEAQPQDAPSVDSLTLDISQAHLELTAASRWIAQNAPRARIVERRRNNYLFFVRAFSNVVGMRPLLAHLPDQCAPYVFPLWVDEPDPGYAELRRIEFPVSRWDWLWPTAPTIENDAGLIWSHNILQLACHQDLTPGELQNMVIILKRLYGSQHASL